MPFYLKNPTFFPVIKRFARSAGAVEILWCHVLYAPLQLFFNNDAIKIASESLLEPF